MRGLGRGSMLRRILSALSHSSLLPMRILIGSFTGDFSECCVVETSFACLHLKISNFRRARSSAEVGLAFKPWTLHLQRSHPKSECDTAGFGSHQPVRSC